MRRYAASALGRIGPAAKEAVPVLVLALKNDKDKLVREYAAYALGGIGPAAKEAVTALTDALTDEDANVHDAAKYALEKIKAEK